MYIRKMFYTEAAYFAGIVMLSSGNALMAVADFGVSVVVAPAYVLSLKLSQYFPFFTFGMADYILQTVLLIFVALLLRRFRWYYLFSFFTAVFSGVVLDGAMNLVRLIAAEHMIVRVVLYSAGVLLCSGGVALLFHTYITPGGYELFVKELAGKYNLDISRVKIIYDCTSGVIAVILSFAFFGLFRFEGIKAGTIICAPVNGWLIGKWSGLYERMWTFRDRFLLRKYFE